MTVLQNRWRYIFSFETSCDWDYWSLLSFVFVNNLTDSMSVNTFWLLQRYANVLNCVISLLDFEKKPRLRNLSLSVNCFFAHRKKRMLLLTLFSIAVQWVQKRIWTRDVKVQDWTNDWLSVTFLFCFVCLLNFVPFAADHVVVVFYFLLTEAKKSGYKQTDWVRFHFGSSPFSSKVMADE